MKDKLVEAQREIVSAGGDILGRRRKGTLPKRPSGMAAGWDIREYRMDSCANTQRSY